MKITKKLISLILAVFCGLIFSTSVLAKEINLYDQPKDDAKVVGKVDLAIGIVPIFTPKDGAWMKVGDPRNGNVGWIKSTDIANQPGAPSAFSFIQKISNDKNGVPQSYQIMQYGTPQNVTPQQAQEIMKKIQQQNATAQESINMIMRNMINDLNALYKQQEKIITGTNSGMPIIMPVIIMPQQEKVNTTQQQPQQNKK